MVSVQNQSLKKHHLVRLVERTDLSPLGLSLTVFCSLGIIGFLPIFWISATRDLPLIELAVPTVTMLINVLAVSYILGMTVFSMRRLKQHLNALRPNYPQDEESFEALQASPEMCRNPKQHLLVTFIGFAFGTLLFAIGRIYENIYGQGMPPGYEAWPMLIIPTLWASIAYTAWIFADNARHIGRAARQLPHMDLFDNGSLMAFTRIGTAQVLFVLGALAVLPLQAILIGDIGLDDFLPPGIVAVLLIGYSILHPVSDARARIREVKQQELEKVAVRLRGIPVDRRMSDDDVPKILAYRTAIEAVDEWPVSGSTFLRLGFYVFIPPVTWALAAVISFYVEAFFEGL